MTDQAYMQEAIKSAKESESIGGCAIGAVLVKEGQILARGCSTPWQKQDPTNHAEIDCIRSAVKEHSMMDTTGCTLYSTCEPCSMCLGACLWSGIDRVVFGAYVKDVHGNEYEYDNFSSETLAKSSYKAANSHNGQIEITGGMLREECAALLKDYKDWQKRS
jgi:tRNA(Arg) A34 adenosine deaminase TadA